MIIVKETKLLKIAHLHLTSNKRKFYRAQTYRRSKNNAQQIINNTTAKNKNKSLDLASTISNASCCLRHEAQLDAPMLNTNKTYYAPHL